MVNILRLYDPDDKLLAEKLSTGWKIEAVFSRPHKIYPDWATGNPSTSHFIECQEVFVLTSSVEFHKSQD